MVFRPESIGGDWTIDTVDGEERCIEVGLLLVADAAIKIVNLKSALATPYICHGFPAADFDLYLPFVSYEASGSCSDPEVDRSKANMAVYSKRVKGTRWNSCCRRVSGIKLDLSSICP